MNLLYRIKRYFTNDWKLVFHEVGFWNITIHNDFGNYLEKDSANYYIYYSPSREEYKLKCEGYKPKTHQMYIVAVKKLLEYENQILKL